MSKLIKLCYICHLIETEKFLKSGQKCIYFSKFSLHRQQQQVKIVGDDFLFRLCVFLFLSCPIMFQIIDIIIEVSGLLFLFSHSHQRVFVPFSSINVPVLPNNVSHRYLKYEMIFRPFCSFSVIPNKEFLFPLRP